MRVNPEGGAFERRGVKEPQTVPRRHQTSAQLAVVGQATRASTHAMKDTTRRRLLINLPGFDGRGRHLCEMSVHESVDVK